MINLVKSSKYKGDKTEIEICSDYIKDIKKHKLKKIKSMKEKGDKRMKTFKKAKSDNKISLDEDEEQKSYNEWVDIDDDMNEKGEIRIHKSKSSPNETELEVNLNKKDAKPSQNEKNNINKINNINNINLINNSDLKADTKKRGGQPNQYEKNSITLNMNSKVDDIMNKRLEIEKKDQIYADMLNILNERGEKISYMENKAEILIADSKKYAEAAKHIKKHSYSLYKNDDFKFEEIHQSKIICYISVILIAIASLVTLLILFFH